MNMTIKNVVVGEFQVNCFVVFGDSKEAIVIDPGFDAASILALLDSEALTPVAYLLTHGHMDHISALAELYEARPAPIGIHDADLEWAFNETNQILPVYPTPSRPPEIVRRFEDGDEFEDGGLAYRVISTPGHTPGGVCFHFYNNNTIFTGDTLFAGSVGRTDLPGGDSRVLKASLDKLASLAESIKVYPGHGPATSIGREKKSNFFMQGQAF